MSNFVECREELENFLSARVPVITLRTIEQPRALRMVREAASSPSRGNVPFWIYTRATGLRDLRSQASVQDDRSFTGAMEFAANEFAGRPQVTLILIDPDDLEADSPATRHIAEIARLAVDNLGSIVLVTDKPIWSGLQRLGMSLRLDLPDTTEMHGIITEFLEDHRGLIDIEWDVDETRQAAEFLQGVTEGEAVNLLASLAVKRSIKHTDVLSLARSKDRIFSDLAGLERVQLRDRAEYQVGGLTNLNQWLARKRTILHADLRGTGLRPPRGVLLVGVPGCGKSLSAKAIAAQWELPLYRLDMGRIHGKYLGESESRMREALETADRVAPCVLWIDEIEKGLAGGNDSTGVPQRITGQFLFWLQESRSRAFVVATANDVGGLPPELLRKGRFDEMFFVDLPDEEDRKDIIELYYSRYVKQKPNPDEVASLVACSHGFSGSDIEASLHEVGAEMLRLRGTGTDLRPSFIRDTFANTTPLSRIQPERISAIRAWGRDHAVPAGRSRRDGASRFPRRLTFMDDPPEPER